MKTPFFIIVLFGIFIPLDAKKEECKERNVLLWAAIKKNNLVAVRQLLHDGADGNAEYCYDTSSTQSLKTSEEKTRPLTYAIQQLNVPLVALLLEHNVERHYHVAVYDDACTFAKRYRRWAFFNPPVELDEIITMLEQHMMATNGNLLGE